MRESGRVTVDDAQPGATVAAGNEFLDAAVVESAVRGAPVFDKDFGKLAAGAQRLVECVLEKLAIDHLAYRKPMPPAPGLSASLTHVVDEADTAVAFGSGDVPVLATPRLIALAEAASIEALADELAPGTTTVGYEVQLAHLAPTPVGGKVTIEATLENVEARRLTFRVSVNDTRGLVAAGKVTRVIVVRDRFIERAQSEH
jgi:fluoroacetyl-CoA thioesterase